MTDEELALVTRLEGYRTTCCDDSRTVPDLIAIIRRLESEVAALKLANSNYSREFTRALAQSAAARSEGAVEALEKAIAFYTELGVTPVIAELKQMRDSYQPHKGEE